VPQGPPRPQDIIKEIEVQFGGSRKDELDRGLLLKQHLRQTGGARRMSKKIALEEKEETLGRLGVNW